MFQIFSKILQVERKNILSLFKFIDSDFENKNGFFYSKN